MIYVAAYIVFLGLFLVGWKRWGDRMAKLDAVEQEFHNRKS